MEKRKTISNVIGSYLKNLRLGTGLTQSGLAEELGISAAYIGFIENAKRLPSVDVLEAYSEYFEIHIDEFLDLRKITIYETVDLLGADTPLAIRNERNMLIHGRDDVLSKLGRDRKLASSEVNHDDEPDIDIDVELMSKNLNQVKLTIKKDGALVIDGEMINFNDLAAKLQELANLSKI